MINFENLFRKKVNPVNPGKDNPWSAHVEDVDYTEIKGESPGSGGNPGGSDKFVDVRMDAAWEAAHSYLAARVSGKNIPISFVFAFIIGAEWADDNPSQGGDRVEETIRAAVDLVFNVRPDRPRFGLVAALSLIEVYSKGAEWADKNPV